ncbi:excinuclease ABC subunit UvrA, partial [Pediococcus acidilactici]|nr:excinuclease ABC subunit UvrA [Pediococcus acidilactici]
QGAGPPCGRTVSITLDNQLLPDRLLVCPTCHGERYNPEIQQIKWHGLSIVDVLNLDVKSAITVFKDETKIQQDLQNLMEVGLGYLHLGENTPSLSGGEAQRLKLVKHLNQQQANTLFVFDEPTIGLHPLDVRVLLQVIQRLLDRQATIIVI